MTVRLTVNGVAVAKARPRFDRRSGRTYTPTKTQKAEAAIKTMAHAAMGMRPPMTGPIRMTVVIRMQIPKSTSRKRSFEMLGRPHVKKPDKDNLEKLLLDALQGIVFEDDSQVFDTRVIKLYGENPATEILIEECNDWVWTLIDDPIKALFA